MLGTPVTLIYKGYSGGWCKEKWQRIDGQNVMVYGFSYRDQDTYHESQDPVSDDDLRDWAVRNPPEYKLPSQLLPPEGGLG